MWCASARSRRPPPARRGPRDFPRLGRRWQYRAMDLIRAAGGLLWREGKDGKRRLAVIHRPHREDWSLPKGKLEDGERWEAAALREVEEETGCRARIVSFAGVVHYVPRRTPKVVVFWHMELVKEGPLVHVDEVDEVVWLTREEALRRLDHEGEREVLVEATAALRR